DAQAEAAREAERRKEADEEGGDGGDTAGGVSRSASSRIGDSMRSVFATVAGLSILASAAAAQASRAAPFTLAQVRSYPFPTELTAAATGARVAWAFNEQGRRNIFVADGPSFSARQLTHYDRDDGQELSSVAVDRKSVV